MSTPLLHRRRMMMAAGVEPTPIFIEKIMIAAGTSARIPLCRTIGDTFELRYIIGGDQRNIINQFCHSEGFIDLSSFNYVRKVKLKDFETTSQDRFGTGLWTDVDNQTLVLGNNYRTRYDVFEYYTTQQDLAISELWFYASGVVAHTWCKRIEVYEGGVLVETFLPAQIGYKVGLYSDVQKKLYVL